MNEYKIVVWIEAHAYAEEKLCDETFEVPGFAIAGPESMEPLVSWRGRELEVTYSDDMTIGEFRDSIVQHIYGKRFDEIPGYVKFTFTVGHDRAEINDPDRNFATLLQKYIDPQETGAMKVCFLVSHDAGVVYTENRLRFYMNSKEGNKHNQPHVHVKDVQHEFAASLDLFTGKVLAGDMPAKLKKEAKRIISDKRDFFIQCWNLYTDGIRIDINHGLGLIQY